MEELFRRVLGMSIAQLSASKRVTQSTSERLSNHMVCCWPVSVLPSGTLSSPNKGAYATGKISEEERLDVIRHACPGSGACGGMFTYGDPFNEVHLCISKVHPSGPILWEPPWKFWVWPSRTLLGSPPSTLVGQADLFGRNLGSLTLLCRESSRMFQSPQILEKSDGT